MNGLIRTTALTIGLSCLGGLAEAQIPEIPRGESRPPWLVTLWAHTSKGLRSECGGVVLRRTDTTLWFATAAHCGSFNFVSIGDGPPVAWPSVNAFRVRHQSDAGDLGVYSIDWKTAVAATEGPGPVSSVWLVREGTVVNPEAESTIGACQGRYAVLKPHCFQLVDGSGYDIRGGDSGSPLMSGDHPTAVISERIGAGKVVAEDLGAAWALARSPSCTGRLDSKDCTKAADGSGFVRQGPARTIDAVLTQDANQLLQMVRRKLEQRPDVVLPTPPAEKLKALMALDQSLAKKDLDFLVWSGLVGKR